MPFVTEELWQRLPRRRCEVAPSIMVADYPVPMHKADGKQIEWTNEAVEAEMVGCGKAKGSRVSGVGYLVLGYRCRVLGIWFWVTGVGYLVLGYRCWVFGFGLQVLGIWFWVTGVGCWVFGFGFKVSGIWFWVIGFGS